MSLCNFSKNKKIKSLLKIRNKDKRKMIILNMKIWNHNKVSIIRTWKEKDNLKTKKIKTNRKKII